MLGAAYGSVSDIEIVWVLVAVVGLTFSLFNFRDALRDKARLIRAKVSNGRMLVAQANLLGEATRAVKQAIFATIGALAMLLPEVPPQANIPLKNQLIGFFIRWGLITASALTTYQSYLGWQIRRALRRR